MKKIILVSTIILLAAGCGKTTTNSPATQNSNQNQQAQQNNQPATDGKLSTISVALPTTPYTSKNDGFTVSYPGTPKIKNSSLPAPGIGQIPVTEYRQEFSAGSEHAYYNVGVYHYPASYKFPDNYLASAFKTFYTVVTLGFPDAAITSQKPDQFLGSPSMSGLISIPTKLTDASTVNTGVYLLITVKGQNTYIISAYGMDQGNYDAFLKSFKFAQ